MKVWEKLFKNEKEKAVAVSPAKGNVSVLEKVNDSVFAEKVLGDGTVISPQDGKLYAPVSGSIQALFPTGHAIAIAGNNGMDILLHIGIDTAEIQEPIFKMHVEQEEQVEQGQLLISYDLDKLKELGYDTSVMVIITNQDANKNLEKKENGPIQVGENLLWLC